MQRRENLIELTPKQYAGLTKGNLVYSANGLRLRFHHTHQSRYYCSTVNARSDFGRLGPTLPFTSLFRKPGFWERLFFRRTITSSARYPYNGIIDNQ